MAAAMDESEAVGAKRDATIKSRRWRRRVATIVIGVQWRRWTMAFEGVGDVRWCLTETAMVRRGGSETTAALPCGARSGDGRGRLMAAASSNGGGDGRKRGGGGKERRNNQIEVMAAAGVIGVQRRRLTMAFEGVGDVRWRST